MMVDVTQAAAAGAVAIAFAIWAAKELWYDKNKKLDEKVDKEVCKTTVEAVAKRFDKVDDSLDYIRDRMDGVYDKMIEHKKEE